MLPAIFFILLAILLQLYANGMGRENGFRFLVTFLSVAVMALAVWGMIDAITLDLKRV